MKVICRTDEGIQEYSFELRDTTKLEEKVIIKAADIVTSKMLQEELNFSTTKMSTLIQNKVFPFVKIGNTYVTTRIQLEDWFRKNAGREVRI
mgnify:CR=1 FL=1